MGSVSSYATAAGKRYRARYRTPDMIQRERKGFKSKTAAREFLTTVEASKLRGEFVDVAQGRRTVAELAGPWLANHTHMKPSSIRVLEMAWRVHVEPVWGDRRIGEIRHSAVQTWVSELASRRSGTTVIRAHGVLAGILDVALRDKWLTTNPARGVNLPRKKSKKRAYLTVNQVELLAANAGERGPLVAFLAYTGLRWGEATALRLSDVDTLRRRVTVNENAVRVGTQIIVGTPKSHESRSVPYPAFLSEILARECEGKRRGQLVFGNGHVHVRALYGRRPWFEAAVQASQKVDAAFPRVTLHDLRHTAASLAISSGANPKAVQRMLGHASAAMTLDTYADLFEDDLDAVADRLDAARSAANVGGMWATGTGTSGRP